MQTKIAAIDEKSVRIFTITHPASMGNALAQLRRAFASWVHRTGPKKELFWDLVTKIPDRFLGSHDIYTVKETETITFMANAAENFTGLKPKLRVLNHTPRAGNHVFEVVFKGFDGRTDKTDHLVKWIEAPTSQAVEYFLTAAKLVSKVRSGVIEEIYRADEVVVGIDIRLDSMGKIISGQIGKTTK